MCWKSVPTRQPPAPTHACCTVLCPLPPPSAGIVSVAVVLKHAAIYPAHEQAVGQLARDMGFQQVPPAARVPASQLGRLLGCWLAHPAKPHFTALLGGLRCAP